MHSNNSNPSPWPFVWLITTKASEYLLNTYYVLVTHNSLREVVLEMRKPKYREVSSQAKVIQPGRGGGRI